jgi:glycosyltransferase involved in cell wall biosynthesis
MRVTSPDQSAAPRRSDDGREGGTSDGRRLVVVSQHFPPDNSGHASRVGDMTTYLDEAGWEVSVLAPPPSFPHGEHPRRWYRTERSAHGGVAVRRLWAWQPGEADPSTLSRLAYYLTFAVHATLWLALHGRRYDVVLTTDPPIFTGLAGFLPALRGTKWVVEVRDLWIDASVSLGFVREGGLFERLSRAFQRAALRRADLLAVTTETLGERLAETYGPELASKTRVVPNGADIARLGAPTDPEPREDDTRHVLVYVGNIGHAQDLESCVRAMAHLEHDAVLRLVGGGDAVSHLRRVVTETGLEDRVQFVGQVPRAAVPGILRAADVGLAPLVKDDGLAYAMPTKVYEYLGCARPVVVTGCGELERFVERSGGGLLAENTPEDIARAVDELLADPERRTRMGRAGHEYVHERYDRRNIARRFDGHLSALLGVEVADPASEAAPPAETDPSAGTEPDLPAR